MNKIIPNVLKSDGSLEPFNFQTLYHHLTEINNCCNDTKKNITDHEIAILCGEIEKSIFNGIGVEGLNSIIVNTVVTCSNKPKFQKLASLLDLNPLYKRILGFNIYDSDYIDNCFIARFFGYLSYGVNELKILDPRLLNYDTDKLLEVFEKCGFDHRKDFLFEQMGSRTLIDRYLIRDRSDKRHIVELPQWLFMRVVLGNHLKELEDGNPNVYQHIADAYYHISNHNFIPSTPNLFNSGTNHPQCSSCYLNTTPDSLYEIFDVIQDCAMLSKWAGGIGTDWSYVRATGSMIDGTNGASQGIIPFIKIYNDTCLAVNQGGKRKGAMAAYLEIWHRDIEEYCELRKNVGDERRRTHDIHHVAWIPDLFMERVAQDGQWTLFCPNDVPELHDTFDDRMKGQKNFTKLYEKYEREIPTKKKKVIKAMDLYKKMLTQLLETGHPWQTFKDACNAYNPQKHCGVIHNSNLCTEITLNTSPTETAVCNLGSLNLKNFVGKHYSFYKEVIATAVRFLDNVIDVNYYPTEESERSNLLHRPIGLGTMGLYDYMCLNDIVMDDEYSEENTRLLTCSLQSIYSNIANAATEASEMLADEKGVYSSWKGSLWHKGYTISGRYMGESTGKPIRVRNSNLLAIAPNATIANIVGVMPCIENPTKNMYMKENLSGNFRVIDRYLAKHMESCGIDIDDFNLDDLEKSAEYDKYKLRFPNNYKVNPKFPIFKTSIIQKYIDQAISTNIFVDTKKGSVLVDIYTTAWKKGLKTTYYLRTKGASQPKAMNKRNNIFSVRSCNIDDTECEACQ